MAQGFLRNNLRLQLIAPVAVTLVTGLVILVAVVLLTQSKGNRLLNNEITAGFNSNEEMVSNSLQNLDTELRNSLGTMTVTTQETLTASSEEAPEISVP